MDDATVCLAIAPVVSFVVSFLKRIPFVKSNPKMIALFFSIAVSALATLHGAAGGIDYTTLLRCVLVQFSGAVATHEIVGTVTGAHDSRAIENANVG